MGTRGLWGTPITAFVALTLAGCGSTPAPARSLDDILQSIAQSQAVDVSVVRAAVNQEAAASDEQAKAVARAWEAELPAGQPLPRLSSTWEDLDRYAAEQLRSTTCAAIFDTLNSGEVPNGDQFAQTYLVNVATGRLPAPTIRAIMDEFDDLAEEAEAGTLDATDIRFSLMKLRYCT